MDELAVAIRLVESAAAELHRLQVGERVTHVYVRTPPGFATDALAFSFRLVAEGSALAGATLEIEECAAPVTGPGPWPELVALDVEDIEPRASRVHEDDDEDQEEDDLGEAFDAAVQDG